MAGQSGEKTTNGLFIGLRDYFAAASLGEVLAYAGIITKALQLGIENFASSATQNELHGLLNILHYLSVGLFMATAVVWLRSSDRKLKKVDDVAEKLVDITKDLNHLQLIARYGHSGTLIANLVGLGGRLNNLVHCQVGGLTISPLLLEQIPRSARDFYQLGKGEQDQLTLREIHIVDSFVLNLIKELPRGSVWLGVTQLQSPEAWKQQTANAAFHEFQEEVVRRTSNGEIIFYRLWCFDDEGHMDQMKEVLKQHGNAGIRTRYLVGDEVPPDMSLTWVPRTAIGSGVASNPGNRDNPIEIIKSDHLAPLCGVRFRTRGSRELDEMTLIAPESDAFKQLRHDFSQCWLKASNVSDSGPV
jgi:hypothetical protein